MSVRHGGNEAAGDGSGAGHAREAPPESPSNSWTRRYILFAFWAVIVALGLPHWLWTTSIHRSILPMDSMNSWAEGKACQLQYPIHVKVASDSQEIGTTKLDAIAAKLSKILKSQDASALYDFYVTSDGVNETALTVSLQPDSKATHTQAILRPYEPTMDIVHNPGRSADSSTLSPFIASEIQKTFQHERDSILHLLEGSAFPPREAIQIDPVVRASLDAKRTRAFRFGSSYHLTFSLFASSTTPSSWEIDKALEGTIQPLVRQMTPISDFTIDTQVQLLASFSPGISGPVYDEVAGQWKLDRSDLSGFINAAEWPLSPSIGSGPTLNFVLYVPSSEQRPLMLGETGGRSWLIPQWGGVQIYNPSEKQAYSITADELHPLMLTFAEQLSSLLGLPPSPPSLALRLSSLTREKTTSLILSASSTLGALARLSLKLESIAIPDSVAKSVDETLYRLEQACHNLQEGKYQDALDNARVAEEEAEKAFFEPSMVGQVYFPDEHKVAVYVPLLGPMAVPLVMTVLKEIKNIMNRRKAKTA